MNRPALTRSKLIRALSLTLWVFGLILWAYLVDTYRQVPNDFLQDYAAGIALSSDQPIYGESIIQIVEERTGFPHIENFHPPFVSLLFSPTSSMSYSIAWIVWSTLYLTLFLVSSYTVFAAFKLPSWQTSLFLPLTLFWYPFYYLVGTGNISALVTAFTVACWYFLRRKRDVLAGAALALACLTKLFPALLLIHLLLFHRWKALASFTATFILGNVLIGSLVGIDTLILYQQDIATRDMESWGLYLLNVSLFGVIYTIVGGTAIVSSPGIFLSDTLEGMTFLKWEMYAFMCCVILASLVIKILRLPRTSQCTEDLSFSFCLVAMLLISPITWMHIFPVLLIPFVFIFQSVKKSGLAFLLTTLALILTCIPDVDLSNWIVVTYAPNKTPYWAYLLTRNGFISLLLLWGLLLSVNPAIAEEQYQIEHEIE